MPGGPRRYGQGRAVDDARYIKCQDPESLFQRIAIAIAAECLYVKDWRELYYTTHRLVISIAFT